MTILVLNSGSSSIKFSLYDAGGDSGQPHVLLDGELSGLGESQATLVANTTDQVQQTHSVECSGVTDGVNIVLDTVTNKRAIDAVGYRVVHPGPRVHDHSLLTEQVLQGLKEAAEFAPLHDPMAVSMIRQVMSRLPDATHVACFDTIFHATMPEEATTYAIPQELRARGVRRYGFHGLSCESVLRQLRALGLLPRSMVIAHLGSGCSVTALRDGQSIDTTMGLTPTGGVVMGTRPGDLDPGLMLYMLRQQHSDDPTTDLERILNRSAGMVALTSLPNDMQAVREAAAKNNEAAVLALKVFTRGIRKAIGGFAWLLGGLDAIVFTGGIGEHDAATRAEILAGTEVAIDSFMNDMKTSGVRRVEASTSQTAVFVVPAQEDLVIALHVSTMLQKV